MPNWIQNKKGTNRPVKPKEEVSISLFVEAPANKLVNPIKEIIEGLNAQDILLLQKLVRNPALKATALQKLRKFV